jgi:peroxiredoxin
MPVEVGQQAPDFELPGRFDRDQGRYQTHRLSEALQDGPVVLQFFPAPFTPGCHRQMCTVRDAREDLYEAAGVSVWGVTGHYPQVIAPWAKQNAFKVPVLGDYDHSVSETYVGFYPAEVMAGLPRMTMRGMIGISTDGVIRYAKIDPVPPTEDDMRAAIAAVTAPAAA